MGLSRLLPARLTHILAAFATKGATAAMLFVQSVVLGRYLGVEALGVYLTAVAVYRVAESTAPFGIPMSTVREIGAAHATRSWQTIRAVALQSVLICLAFGALASVALVAGRGVIAATFDNPGEAALALGWMAFAIAPGCGAMALSATLRGLGHQAAANILGSMVVSLIATASFMLWQHDTGFIGAIQAYILGQVTALTLLALYVWAVSRKGTGDAPVRHSLFQSAPSFWIISLASFGNDSLGVLLLGMLSTINDASIFGVAARLALPLAFLSASIQAVYEPRFAGAYRTLSFTALREEFRVSMKHSIVLATAMLIGMTVCAEPLLLLFGREFGDAHMPFLVLLVGLCTMAAFGPAGSLLAMTGKPKYNASIALAALPLSVLAHILLIPVFGAMGAAVATTAVLIVRTLVQAWAAFAHIRRLTTDAPTAPDMPA